METVRQLLDQKGGDVWTIAPDASVYDAIRLMAEKRIGALVVAEGQKPVGILSERDYARKIILQDRSSKSTPVRDIMTEKVIYVRPDQSIEDCMTIMTRKQIRHLPVLEQDRLVGIVSIGDAVKEVISEREFMIQQLENYITGG